MAQKKQLQISISPTGEVSVTVKCIDGQSCVDETKFLENALGNTIESRELTEDYYKQGEVDTVTNKTSG
ncbi:MAG: DUF2997 domain-containing protein [Myxococcales bacterium]|nr:DUF2997 domain-containing protein [Myxococcales bacterium]